ncbi:hypothetical protein UFOVP425_6 [uncultured Caudovirales phage]|uniref:Uncharacterized protein n=1 Tax=uncultured Caudovirales phage TaxID=2100421 RepID=A0A6J5M5J2_9CAUD|nr:hypothetical protein UFOVP425_6 [uncultured Caudovirales phage]
MNEMVKDVLIMTPDEVVRNVLKRFNARSWVGIDKYSTTLERDDLSTLEWLTHAQEEAMDFVLYLERLKQEIESIKEFDNWKEWLNRNIYDKAEPLKNTK